MNIDSITIGRNASLTIAIMTNVGRREAKRNAKRDKRNRIVRAFKQAFGIVPVSTTRNQYKP
jgi:hypothetical protein